MAEGEGAPKEQPTAPGGPAGRGKRIIAYVLVVLATLCAFLAIFALWANRQALNTGNFTESSSQILESDAVREQLSIFLVNTLYENVDVQGQLQAVLPGRAKALAPPAASALRDLAQDGTDQLLAQPRAQQVWEKIVRRTHHALLNVLDEKSEGEVLQGGKGTVSLDLRELLIRTAQRIGLSGNLVSQIPKGAAQIEILRSNELETTQDLVGFVRHLPLILLGLMIIFVAIALGITRGHRRKILRAFGIGLIVAGAGAILLRNAGGSAVVEQLASTEAVKPAVQDVWTISTSLLVSAAWASVGYGVVVLAGAILAGPSRPATSLRRATAPYFTEPGIAYGGLAILVLIVLIWSPTPATRQFWPMLLLIIFAAIGTEALRRQVARENPAARDVDLPSAGEHLSGLAARARAGASKLPRPGGSGGGDDRLAELERLAGLKEKGVLSAEEFEQEKKRVLGNGEDA